MPINPEFDFTDERSMSAREKHLVIRAWERFLDNGLQKKDFTKRLYQHLTLHCSFIAHYSIHGFHSVYFEDDKQATRNFIRQFTTGRSTEYGGNYWLHGSCADLNKAMMLVMARYADKLIRASRNDPFEDVPDPDNKQQCGRMAE